MHGFEDLIDTGHTRVSFDLNLNICKKLKIKRSVNFKKANWSCLKEFLIYLPWDQDFVDDDVNASLSNWCDMFLSAVDDHIPKRICHRVYDLPLALTKNFWTF